MITNGFIYEFIRAITNKDDRGNVFSPDDFSLYLPKSNLEFYNMDYQKWELTQRISDTLRHFYVRDNLTLTNGAINIPTNYKHAINASYTDFATRRNIDIVTKNELNRRRSSPILQPTARNPIMSITDSQVLVYPTTITFVDLEYLRLPVRPVFDYYYKGGTVVTYLPPGETHTATTTDPYQDGSTSGDHISQSVELEYDDDDKIKIISIILSYYGLSIPDQLILQAAEANKAKQENMT